MTIDVQLKNECSNQSNKTPVSLYLKKGSKKYYLKPGILQNELVVIEPTNLYRGVLRGQINGQVESTASPSYVTIKK